VQQLLQMPVVLEALLQQQMLALLVQLPLPLPLEVLAQQPTLLILM
jgi:hypothetical protein